MPESAPQHNEEEARELEYLNEQLAPHRENAKAILIQSGFTEETPGFAQAQETFAKRMHEIQMEGETDPLTNELNRKGFSRRMDEEIAKADREGYPIAILLMDVDGLKARNDGPGGHPSGDDLLRGVASEARKALRKYDPLARYGGDEFGIIIPRADEVVAAQIWNRMNTNFQSHVDSAGNPDPIAISAGAAVINTRNPGESAKWADSLSYLSKFIRKAKIKDQAGADPLGEKPSTSNILMFAPRMNGDNAGSALPIPKPTS